MLLSKKPSLVKTREALKKSHSNPGKGGIKRLVQVILFFAGTLIASDARANTLKASGFTAAHGYDNVTAGTISPAFQSVNYGWTPPSTLAGTAATGGDGTYSYQWQSSTDKNTWTNIAGATGTNYTSGGLTSTTYFRRTVTSNGLSANSNTATINVNPTLTAGIAPLSQSITPNARPRTLACLPAGGNRRYTYQWQMSADSITFANITGATDSTYNPGALTSMTYYRVLVISNVVRFTTRAAVVFITNAVALASAPSPDQNYVMASVPRIPAYDPATTTYTTYDVNQTIQYIDGLGRPLQTVQIKASPTARDIVTPIVYDQYGREAQKYLPYAAAPGRANGGGYRSDALTSQASFYNTPQDTTWNAPGVVTLPVVNGITPSFSQTVFEPSPLNRVTEQGATGADWQPLPNSTGGHTMKMAYTTNNLNSFSGADTAVSMRVTLYNAGIDSNQSRTLTIGNAAGNYYLAGQLYVTVSKDENWKSGRGGTTEEYKDIEGHVILKRTFNWVPGTPGMLQMLSTYYVYDDLGNLAFVLPPLSGADNGLTSVNNQTVLDNLCYQYRYDERNRLSRKRVPGKDWEYMVYNQLDQLVLSQDANQRATNQWTVIKYDALGREIVTGLWTDGAAQAQSDLQKNIYKDVQWDKRNTNDTNTGYTISSYPALLNTYLSINYYDDYSFGNITGLPASFNNAPAGVATQTTGLLTASKINVLGTVNMLWDVNYYDGFGRNIQTYKQHYLGGGTPNANNYDVVTSTYNFNNAVTATTRKHYNTTNTTAPVLTIANTYYYDHMGRKRSSWEQITIGSTLTPKTLLSKIDYNEVGQVQTKHLHSTDSVAFLQDISYAYNERGWLSRINDPAIAPTTKQLFAEQLNYNSNLYGATPQYNGNIASQAYQAYNIPATGIQTVAYSYDALNRLQAGTSSTGYSETGITYDLGGNIKTLTRTGPNAATLAYAYYNNGSSNQLQTVTNALNPFRSYDPYDANGNAPGDGAGKAFVYNLLNLPQTVIGPGLNIAYTYDAGGQKLRKVSSIQGTTDYISGIQYKTNSTVIDFIQTEEGRVLNPTTSPNYEYTLTDHLGNNRVTFDQTTGKVGEEDYYPFGLNVHHQQNAGNKYLYNKKELQEELNQYDYGARFYDPVIARWTTPDPLAELSRRWSPYNYGDDNPVRNIDPDGRSTESWMQEHGITNNDLITVYQAPAQQDDPKKENKSKQKQDQSKPAPRLNPDWFYNTPVLAEASKTNDSFQNGDYWEAAAHQLTGILEALTFGEGSQVTSLWESFTGLFGKKVVAESIVYHSVSNGITQYVGITDNFARREAEHLAQKGINIQPLMQKLTRLDARAVEQVLIEMHGLGSKGGTLLNKINSIAKSNPIYSTQLERGYQLLKSIGYK